jgi:hypothetical protein
MIKQLYNPDFTKLVKMVTSYVDNFDPDAEDEDDVHYIFEQALKSIYGDDIFDKLYEE